MPNIRAMEESEAAILLRSDQWLRCACFMEREYGHWRTIDSCFYSAAAARSQPFIKRAPSVTSGSRRRCRGFDGAAAELTWRERERKWANCVSHDKQCKLRAKALDLNY